MASTNYKEYLAANVISEGSIVSYRNLSRALKVHSNAAKQMLYEFHQTQNQRKPGSIHASYLVGGTPKPIKPSRQNDVKAEDGEDSAMPSSSVLDSSVNGDIEEEAAQVPIHRFVIVKEEDLEAARSSFERLSTIHIYSLEPGTLNNMEVLSDCNRRIAAEFGHEDLLETWKQYGTIHNPLAKRRTGRRPPLAAAPVQPMTSGMKPTAASQANSQTTSRNVAALDTKSANESDATKKPATKPSSLKRNGSDIFKAFSKSKTEPNTGKTASPTPPKPDQAAEDEPMKDASEEENEEDFVVENSKEAAERAEASRKAKSERADKLRQMMEQEDEDESMQESPAAPASPEDDEVPDAQAGVKDESEHQPETEEPPQVTVSGGRRRGKRKVMKKKTTKDAEGYLVTKEEPVWESFSEDEPEPKKAKPPISAPASQQQKTKKGGKPGQGNIMSFFSKK